MKKTKLTHKEVEEKYASQIKEVELSVNLAKQKLKDLEEKRHNLYAEILSYI